MRAFPFLKSDMYSSISLLVRCLRLLRCFSSFFSSWSLLASASLRFFSSSAASRAARLFLTALFNILPSSLIGLIFVFAFVTFFKRDVLWFEVRLLRSLRYTLSSDFFRANSSFLPLRTLLSSLISFLIVFIFVLTSIRLRNDSLLVFGNRVSFIYTRRSSFFAFTALAFANSLTLNASFFSLSRVDLPLLNLLRMACPLIPKSLR